MRQPALAPGAAARLRALLTWLVLLALAAPSLAADDTLEGTVVLRSAVAAVGEGPWFPALPAPVQAVTLPDDWATSRPGFQGTLWYRATLDYTPARGANAAAAPELLALYIARACSNYQVQLNGLLVASGGRMREPVSSHCARPQLVNLPAALLLNGRNEIDIQLVGHRLAEVGSAQRAGGLSELVVGPHAVLAPYHTRQTLLAVGFAQGASATLLLMGGFMFVLGYVNRRESQLAYFGALSVGLALFDARLWLREVPLAHRLGEFMLLVLLSFITWAAVQFLLRSRGMRLRRADAGLPVQCALVALSLLLAGPERLHLLALVWTAVFALEIGAASVLLLRHPGSAETRWTTTLLLGVAGLAVLADASAGHRTGIVPALLASLGLPLVVLFVGLRLVMQHGRARREAEASREQLERSKRDLELRVHDATQEIERNMRQLADHKVEQVAERERKRIAADLHDDLGAKLLTIVHTSESDRISTLAREALEEMRLSVRGLTGRPVRLADAMGDWRAETVSRLNQAGIEGEWHGPDDVPQTLSSRAYVQCTRILREATSNIIKHSGASHCSITCVTADGDFQLIIQDNGDGIVQHDVDSRLDKGHGLASMKNRAKQLQGQCLVESGPGYGTVIRLTLPLDRATAPS